MTIDEIKAKAIETVTKNCSPLDKGLCEFFAAGIFKYLESQGYQLMRWNVECYSPLPSLPQESQPLNDGGESDG